MMKTGLFPAVACLQFAITLGEMESNIAQVNALLKAQTLKPDTLVLLPEVWATGFDYLRTEELGKRTPEVLAVMQKLAREHQIYLAGSLTEPGKGDNLPRNTLFVVGPAGVVGSISKQHLFHYWQEDRYYQAGVAGKTLTTPYGSVAGMICYDLRFPEVARNQIFAGNRLLIISAEWPLSRLTHWQTLVRARAIENQCYVVACNGCGRTGKMEMAGHSLIIDPNGAILAEAGTEPAFIKTPLVEDAVDAARRQFFPAGNRPWLGSDADKILSLTQLAATLAPMRHYGTHVAFTNGCFDLLHAGHVSYLEKARTTADCLVVGLNTDSSVRRLKGDHRPINSEQMRARVLAALGCVDFVVLFDEDTPLDLIKAIMPDVLVKGADYEENEIVGATEVKAAGGRVERIAFEHNCSTTALISTIQQQ